MRCRRLALFMVPSICRGPSSSGKSPKPTESSRCAGLLTSQAACSTAGAGFFVKVAGSKSCPRNQIQGPVPSKHFCGAGQHLAAGRRGAESADLVRHIAHQEEGRGASDKDAGRTSSARDGLYCCRRSVVARDGPWKGGDDTERACRRLPRYMTGASDNSTRRKSPMAQITLNGNPIHTNGELPTVGAKAPDFKLTGGDLKDVSLADYKGKKKILNIVPSLDTSVCATSTRRFNEAGPLAGITARAVAVLDENDRVVYRQLVPEIGQEPDYDKALAAAR